MKTRLHSLVFVLIVALMASSCIVDTQLSQPTNTPHQVQATATEETVVVDEDERIVPFEAGDLTALYEKVNPSVVSVRTITESEGGFEGGGLGTGFVWDEEGHIVTNFHVVRNATDLEVDFPSGFKTRADVIGTDPDSDLAVLALENYPPTITPLDLGSSRELQVGQIVVAIGNPKGLKGTMTFGIVSALGRTLDSLREAPGGGVFATGNIIQTDAAINPGNSGGPLLDMSGKVIGINSAIQTSSIDLTGQPVNSGLGFAISIDQAKNVVPDLIREGEHESPYVGIRVQSEITLFTQEELDLPRSTGVYVLEVTEGSPADEAGLVGALDDVEVQLEDLETMEVYRGGDLIIAIDEQPVQNFDDFMGYLLAYKKPGDTIELTVLRGDEEVNLELTLGSRPD
ncbi:MAG: trypsin-like peptidase domain-containing protein [Anaerolineales bacterium]